MRELRTIYPYGLNNEILDNKLAVTLIEEADSQAIETLFSKIPKINKRKRGKTKIKEFEIDKEKIKKIIKNNINKFDINNNNNLPFELRKLIYSITTNN